MILTIYLIRRTKNDTYFFKKKMRDSNYKKKLRLFNKYKNGHKREIIQLDWLKNKLDDEDIAELLAKIEYLICIAEEEAFCNHY